MECSTYHVHYFVCHRQLRASKGSLVNGNLNKYQKFSDVGSESSTSLRNNRMLASALQEVRKARYVSVLADDVTSRKTRRKEFPDFLLLQRTGCVKMTRITGYHLRWPCMWIFLFHRDIHPRGVGPTTTAGENFEYQTLDHVITGMILCTVTEECHYYTVLVKMTCECVHARVFVHAFEAMRN